MPRPSHIFREILEELRKLIVFSVSPGEPLPSNRELARTYGVAPDTIHRALRLLAREKLVRISPRVGSIRVPDRKRATGKRRRATLRVGIISLSSELEWQHSALFGHVINEAASRNISLVPVPNPRVGRTTPGRSRLELTRIPWNTFDVGMLFEIEDAKTLSDPALQCRTVMAIDQDATSYGIDSVSYNNWHAGQLAARHLFEIGHRRFAVSDETNNPEWPIDAAWTERRLGFESELSRMGGIIRPAWRVEMPRYRPGFDPVNSFRRQIASWLAAEATEQPTAFFSVCVYRLGEFIRELTAARIGVPRDLSIVALAQNRESATVSGIRLTHISVNAAALVSRAFDAAQEIAEIGRVDRTARLFSVPVLLVPGDSAAGPNQNGY